MDFEYALSTSLKQSVVKLLIKRTFDFLFSLFALIFFSPVFALIALAIKITEGSPVLFIQERVGLNGQTFMCLKFRTMIVDADKKLDELKCLNEASGPVFKIKNDPRITGVGNFLRKSGLDELPQFINVLKGEMSVVGPRPLLPREVACLNAHQMKRFSVKPGITCTWQVARNRNEIPFEHWVEMDLDYIRNGNLGTDIKLIAQTIKSIFTMSGC